MKFIVGLGNIGAKYDDTRHNAGFMALDAYAHSEDMGNWHEKKKFNAHIIQGGGVFLIKPTTYMNLSGQSIAAAMAFYGVKPEDILIVHDDIDIDFGTIRIRQGGGSAGHNGIKSLPQSVQEKAWRARIGVRNEHFAQTDTSDFVLKKFSTQELSDFDRIITITNNVLYYFSEGEINPETVQIEL